MTDDRKPPRRPFGERDDLDRQRPFGAVTGGHGRSTPPPEPPAPVESDPSPADGIVADDGVTAADDDIATDDGVIGSSVRRADTPSYFPAPFGSRRGGYRPMESYYEGLREPDPDPEPEPEPEPLVAVLDDLDAEPEAEDEPEPQPAPGGASGEDGERPAIRFGVVLCTLAVIALAAGGVATLFTWWTPNAFLPNESVDQLSVALATQSSLAVPPPPTSTPEPTPDISPPPEPPPVPRIGIVAGHSGVHPSSGQPDPGSVCPDGLTEAEVNMMIATQVVDWLRQHGYEVDLLEEFDSRLPGYQANALVSIHADSCDYINEVATGFKVASFAESNSPEEDARLVACLVNRYATTTGLQLHNSITFDMTQYHTFREVADTPGAIIEVGFLNLDREFLTQSPDVAALGIARGILCYLRNEPIDGPAGAPPPEQQPTPIP
ncbi:MAG: N-acetylmuramoyl-L-alanine amidase [Chloroflexi bacterium]|nr:N-acetylmuramoyl-L-alanine amidase [Chloroflexota bacterium]